MNVHFVPLKAKDFKTFVLADALPSDSVSRFRGLLGRIQGAGHLRNARTQWIAEKSNYVANVLSSRPVPPLILWGENRTRQKVAIEITSVLVRVLEWPNNHFIPDDDLEMAFWCDGYKMGTEKASLDIIDKFGIDIKFNDWNQVLYTGTLGDLVDLIIERGNNLPEADMWPPAPIG